MRNRQWPRSHTPGEKLALHRQLGAAKVEGRGGMPERYINRANGAGADPDERRRAAWRPDWTVVALQQQFENIFARRRGHSEGGSPFGAGALTLAGGTIGA